MAISGAAQGQVAPSCYSNFPSSAPHSCAPKSGAGGIEPALATQGAPAEAEGERAVRGPAQPIWSAGDLCRISFF